MRTRRKSYGETGKRKRKLCDLNPDSSSSFSYTCSSKEMLSSILTIDQDKYMLLYLQHLANRNETLGESYSYNWWNRLAEKLSNKSNTSLGTDACIMASRGHESMYMQYHQSEPEMLKHSALDSAKYLQVLHDVYRKNRTRVLRHPSISRGPITPMRGSGSGSGGPMGGSGSGDPRRRSASGSRSLTNRFSSGCSTIYCHSDDWCDWEEKLTPLLLDLYNKDLLTSPEVDQIAEHFKKPASGLSYS